MITICETCKGLGKILIDKEGFAQWCCEPKPNNSKTFSDFQGTCPVCRGTKITPPISYIPNGIELRLKRSGKTIFGPFEDIVRIKTKNGGGSFDLWIDDKKLKKQAKGPLSDIILGILRETEFRYESTAEIIGPRGRIEK